MFSAPSRGRARVARTEVVDDRCRGRLLAPHSQPSRSVCPVPPRRRSRTLVRAKCDMKPRQDPVFSPSSWFHVTSAPRKATRKNSSPLASMPQGAGARGASGSCGYGALSRSCLKAPWPYRQGRARCPSLPKRLCSNAPGGCRCSGMALVMVLVMTRGGGRGAATQRVRRANSS